MSIAPTQWTFNTNVLQLSTTHNNVLQCIVVSSLGLGFAEVLLTPSATVQCSWILYMYYTRDLFSASESFIKSITFPVCYFLSSNFLTLVFLPSVSVPLFFVFVMSGFCFISFFVRTILKYHKLHFIKLYSSQWHYNGVICVTTCCTEI